ncbi:MAG: hypothetical protein CMP20_12170 [Rickettsiales bacterium]|nr:hypothetical protein [Rickettsiales bacterium]
MPAPTVLRNLTPETKIVPNPPPGQPVIATKLEFRDGTRQTGPAAPTFTLSATSNSITATITQGNGAASYEIRVDSGSAFSGLSVTGLTAEQTYVVQVRGLNAEGVPGEWSVAVNQSTTAVPVIPQGVIFQEDFDDQPDYTATMHTLTDSQKSSEGAIVPDGWTNVYQTTSWSPETGYPDKHASIEILASNTDKTRTGTGKSFVKYRESSSPQWNSDGQLQVVFDTEHDEIYLEFWISFSANWAARTVQNGGLSKIARIGYYNGGAFPFNGAAGDLGPVLFWDYYQNDYGQRNTYAFRGGPAGYNYTMDLNAEGVNDQTNFTSDTVGVAVGGGNPQLVDHVNGGILADVDRYDFLNHNRLWGPAGHWTKVGLYVKMNSAPGVNDGLMMMFLNDERVKLETTVPWCGANPGSNMVGWNFIAIGGNSSFYPYPSDQRFEDWYAIDDLVVMNTAPEGLL